MAFASAGTVSFALSAFQSIKNSLLSLPKGVFDETSLQVFLEDELCKFHEKHIFKHPRYGYTDGPQVSFIIAAQFKDSASLSLFSTDETTVNPEYGYCFTGSGAELAKYIVYPLAMTQLHTRPMSEVLLLATHMLRQVQMSAGGCGQGGSFFRLSVEGWFHDVQHFALPNIDTYSDKFQGIIDRLFYAAADLDMDDQLVKFSVQLTDRLIQEIRDEQREEKKRREELQKKLLGEADNQ